MEYAIQLLVTLLLFLYAGYWVDQKYRTAPWGTLGGLLVGMLLGLGMMYKKSAYAMEARKKRKQDPQSQKDEEK